MHGALAGLACRAIHVLIAVIQSVNTLGHKSAIHLIFAGELLAEELFGNAFSIYHAVLRKLHFNVLDEQEQ